MGHFLQSESPLLCETGFSLFFQRLIIVFLPHQDGSADCLSLLPVSGERTHTGHARPFS
jgi:hypothetical protein